MNLILQEMRIKQWTKNFLVYAAPLFGGVFFVKEQMICSTFAFVAFCLASSSIYFFNDIADVEKDRQNSKKCKRPIAAGKISVGKAYLYAFLFCLLAGALSHSVNAMCFKLLIVYVVMNICYTLKLKHIVIIDVMIIASGFVIRGLMGAVAIGTDMTVWFLLCVMFLSLFLALGKRRYELKALEGEMLSEGRKVLKFYSVELIDQLMTIVTTALLICYVFFAVDTNTRNSESMVYTVPLVMYGVFYYLYVVRVKRGGEAPDEVLYKERPILFVVLAYFACILLIRNI